MDAFITYSSMTRECDIEFLLCFLAKSLMLAIFGGRQNPLEN